MKIATQVFVKSNRRLTERWPGEGKQTTREKKRPGKRI